MYSQYWSDFNTVFLITIFGCFLHSADCFITLFMGKRQEVACRCGVLKSGYSMWCRRSGDGVDAGRQNAPKNETRQQNNGPNMTATPLHF
jgi:hypothetical protein